MTTKMSTKCQSCNVKENEKKSPGFVSLSRSTPNVNVNVYVGLQANKPTTQQPAPCSIRNTKFLSRGTKDEAVDARDAQPIHQHCHRHCAEYHGCLEAEGKQLLERNITKLPFVSGTRLEI